MKGYKWYKAHTLPRERLANMGTPGEAIPGFEDTAYFDNEGYPCMLKCLTDNEERPARLVGATAVVVRLFLRPEPGDLILNGDGEELHIAEWPPDGTTQIGTIWGVVARIQYGDRVEIPSLCEQTREKPQPDTWHSLQERGSIPTHSDGLRGGDGEYLTQRFGDKFHWYKERQGALCLVVPPVGEELPPELKGADAVVVSYQYPMPGDIMLISDGDMFSFKECTKDELCAIADEMAANWPPVPGQGRIMWGSVVETRRQTKPVH